MLFIFLSTLVLAIEAFQVVENPPESGHIKDDFIIKLGGLHTVYHRESTEQCDRSKMFSSSVQWLDMILFTLDRINSDVTILPGVRLVLEPFDDCLVDTRALKRIVDRYLTSISDDQSGSKNNSYWGVIGPETSAVSIPTAKLLGLFHIPQISYAATSPVLSDKQRFPYFFRTIPSDNHQIEAMIQILEYNKWEFVSFIYEDDNYGNHAFDAFKKQIETKRICLAIEAKIPRSTSSEAIDNIIGRLAEEKNARVVIVFVTEYNLALLLKHVIDRKLQSRFQWIGSDTWNGIQISELQNFLNNDSYAEALEEAVNGSLSITIRSKSNHSFETYLRSRTPENTKNPYFAEYLSLLYKCNLSGTTEGTDVFTEPCPSNLTLPKSQDLVLTLETAADAALVFAHALNNAQRTLCNNSLLGVCDEFARLSGKELKRYLRNVSFTDPLGRTFAFDDNQDGPALYDIWRYDGIVKKSWNLVGKYEMQKVNFSSDRHAAGRGNVTSRCGQECDVDEYMFFQETQTCCWVCLKCDVKSIVIKNSSYSGCHLCEEGYFANVQNQTCVLVPVAFLSYDESWAWPVTVLSLIGLVLTFLTTVMYMFAWDSALIRASGRELSSLILIGLALGFATSFFFCFRPTRGLCAVRRVASGVGFTLVYSAVLVKTVRISLIFNTLGKRLDRDYKRLLRPIPQIAITLILTAIEMFLLGIWLALQPPRVNKTRSLATDDGGNVLDFLNCEGLQSHVLVIGLAFPLVLLVVCSIYAFRIRKVPQGFNEARHIGFAVYTTLVIWLAQISTYLANSSTNMVLRDAIYCLGLSLNGFVILFAMFGPKIYIVVFRPEKNNQRMVMGTQTNGVRSLSSQHTLPANSLATRNESRVSNPEVTNATRKQSSQLQLPQTNGKKHHDIYRRIRAKRKAHAKKTNQEELPYREEPSLTRGQDNLKIPSDFYATGLEADDMSVSSEPTDDDTSVTSHSSDSWQKNIMSSCEATKANVYDSKESGRDEKKSEPFSIEILDKSSDGTRQGALHYDLKDASAWRDGCENQGTYNPSFQLDRPISRVRSLPSNSDELRVVKSSNLATNYGSLKVAKITSVCK